MPVLIGDTVYVFIRDDGYDCDTRVFANYGDAREALHEFVMEIMEEYGLESIDAIEAYDDDAVVHAGQSAEISEKEIE